MTEIVTTGRPMTGGLQRALDNLTGSRRKVTILALNEAAQHDGTLAPLHEALALELRLCELREVEALRDLEQAATALPQDDDRPWPQATGRAVMFDPETRAFRDTADGELPDAS